MWDQLTAVSILLLGYTLGRLSTKQNIISDTIANLKDTKKKIKANNNLGAIKNLTPQQKAIKGTIAEETLDAMTQTIEEDIIPRDNKLDTP